MSYHRPRVFRSLHGCCICKAKSSSSRFTDSQKYNDTFHSCFDLTEIREGEICNACVLLVKRFRKLPEKSKKNWSHVVDARAGPGVKSFVRKPRRPPDITPKKKHVYRRRANKRKAADVAPIIDDESPPPPRLRRKRVEESPFRHTDSPLSMLSTDFKDDFELIEELEGGGGSSRAWTPESRSYTPPSVRAMSASPAPSISTIPPSVPLVRAAVTGARARKRLILTKTCANPALTEPVCGFFDSFLWKREKSCCGAIFKGPFGEVVIDPRLYRPCPSSSNTPHTQSLLATNGHVTPQLLGAAKVDKCSNLPVNPIDILSDKQTSMTMVDHNVTRLINSDLLLASSVVVRTVASSVTSSTASRLSSSPTSSSNAALCSVVASSAVSSCSSAASTVSGATSFESLIESELKAFGLESPENSNEDDEAIDFYCNENLEDMKTAGGGVDSHANSGAGLHHEDIDEGFFDKPARQDKIRLSCESPSQLSL